jgi:hypothetical protein
VPAASLDASRARHAGSCPWWPRYWLYVTIHTGRAAKGESSGRVVSVPNVGVQSPEPGEWELSPLPSALTLPGYVDVTGERRTAVSFGTERSWLRVRSHKFPTWVAHANLHSPAGCDVFAVPLTWNFNRDGAP